MHTGEEIHTDEEADRIVAQMASMEGERESWETTWQEISDYIIPRKSGINTIEPKGEQRTIRLHDTTAIRANEKFASGLYGYLTPPGKKWFALEAENNDLQKIPEVRDWFSRVSDRMSRKINQSNFQAEIHELYLQIASFGTTCLYLEQDDKGELVFTDIPIGRYYIAEDQYGLVDTIYRRFPYTARQAVQRFGTEALPKAIVDIYEDADGKESQKQFIFIHAVEPRSNYLPYKKDNMNMPIVSAWVSKEFSKVVKESGYEEMPYFCTRYLKSNTEIYGRCPGTAHISDVRQINLMEKTIITQVEKIVNPPILIPDDGATTYKFRTAPNSINYWKATNGANKPEPFVINNPGSLSFGEDKLEQKRNTIREAFHNDFFQAVTNADKTMTATEVMEIIEEKIVSFSPTMGRMQDELYEPLLERVFNIMFRAGEFPEIPQGLLEDPRFKVVYSGKISQALKMVENKATLQTLDQIVPYAEIKPEILDIYNFDNISRDIGINNGMVVDHFNDEAVVEQIRQGRAQQEQARAEAEMQQMNAQSANNMASAEATMRSA